MKNEHIMTISDIDIKEVFRDTKGLGRDPDKYSDELGKVHCLLWSSKGKLGTIQWNYRNRLVSIINGKEYIFTPDSITNSFCDSKQIAKGMKEKEIISSFGNEVYELLQQYNIIDYTIGSSIIFPITIDGNSFKWTMNVARGLSAKVHDRIDYTLECIKRYYDRSNGNPLQSALEKSDAFFRLFNSFREYVDFFFLNDLVDDNYNVISFTGDIDFQNSFPFPKDQYIKYLSNTILFIQKRNKRINDYILNYREK